MSAPATHGGDKQYATFAVDGLLFGVDVLCVQEVLHRQEMTKAPGSLEMIAGLINLRGQIVTALDMRSRLGLPRRADGEAPTNVVLRADGGAISLLADEIGDVIHVDPKGIEPPPPTVDAAVRPMIEGVYKLQDRLLLVLAADRVLQAEARS